MDAFFKKLFFSIFASLNKEEKNKQKVKLNNDKLLFNKVEKELENDFIIIIKDSFISFYENKEKNENNKKKDN